MSKEPGIDALIQGLKNLSSDEIDRLSADEFVTEIVLSDLPVGFSTENLAIEFKKLLLAHMPERPTVTWINGIDSVDSPVIKFAFAEAVEKDFTSNLLITATDAKIGKPQTPYTLEFQNKADAYNEVCEQIDDQLAETGMMTKIHVSFMPANADLLRTKNDFQTTLYEVAPYLKFDLWEEAAAEGRMKEWAFTFDRPVEIAKFRPIIDGIVRKEIFFCGFEGEAWNLSILPGHITFPGPNRIPKPEQP